jgi:hypothetical protein
MKKIYHYNQDGCYCGQDIADESPLEPGVYLIPALATDQKPPTPGENQLVRFVNREWILEDIPIAEPESEPSNETEIITPPVDQNTADIWQAMLDLSTKIEGLKGGI